MHARAGFEHACHEGSGINGADPESKDPIFYHRRASSIRDGEWARDREASQKGSEQYGDQEDNARVHSGPR